MFHFVASVMGPRPQGGIASSHAGMTQLPPETAKAEKISLGFPEVPYFLKATYLRMEIKGLVMYPKG